MPFTDCCLGEGVIARPGALVRLTEGVAQVYQGHPPVLCTQLTIIAIFSCIKSYTTTKKTSFAQQQQHYTKSLVLYSKVN